MEFYCSTQKPPGFCFLGVTMNVVILVVMLWGMPWPQTGATHYHAQLGLPDKGRAIKGLVVCNVVWIGSMIYGRRKVRGSGPLLLSGWLWAQVPQHSIDAYRIQMHITYIIRDATLQKKSKLTLNIVQHRRVAFEKQTVPFGTLRRRKFSFRQYIKTVVV